MNFQDVGQPQQLYRASGNNEKLGVGSYITSLFCLTLLLFLLHREPSHDTSFTLSLANYFYRNIGNEGRKSRSVTQNREVM